MEKQKRMGSDPLGWIKDSRQEAENPAGGVVTEIRPKEVKPAKSKPKTTKQEQQSTDVGLGWKRATFIVRKEKLEKLKDVAYWERKEIKEVMDDVLGQYLSDKTPKARPKKKAL